VDFYSWIHDRFRHDQHEALIRQLFHIKQSGLVQAYVDQFSVMVDQLVAYESDANPLYYAMRFVDGLRDDSRSVVMIQRPSTLDSACALALVQEEAMDSGRKKDIRRLDSSFTRSAPRQVLPLPPPPRLDKLVGPVFEVIEVNRAPTSDDKMRALKQYIRARGLCDKCAEKWTYGHKCSSSVQLHAIHELWELFTKEASELDESVSEVNDHSTQLCVCLSEAVVMGMESSKSMKLLGTIQGQQMLILLDPGSSHTFISARLADALSHPRLLALQKPLVVKVASGAPMCCASQIS
jgi:hypothetical protein